MSIHGITRGYDIEPGRNDNYGRGIRCPDCGVRIQNRSTRCKPCAQRMRRKIDAQVARLLALRDVRREEVEAQHE